MDETVALMDLIPILTSPTCIAAFSSGVLFGSAWSYYFTRLRPTRPEKIEGPILPVPATDRLHLPVPEDEYRLILGIRNDLKMQKGKVAAQCGHASVDAYAKAWERRPEDVKKWLEYGGTKITVKVESEEELVQLKKAADACDILSCVIRDAGHTQVAPGSKTVIAIGPAPKPVLDKITGHLKLY